MKSKQPSKCSQLIKFQNEEDTYQYIYFYPSVPKNIIAPLQEPDKMNQQKIFQQFYSEIIGFTHNYFLEPLIKNQQDIIQILKHISQFGGLFFKGGRHMKNDKGLVKQFGLKLNHIQNINFKNLKTLDFSMCSLGNIEAIAWLDMKFLQNLCVKSNEVVSLRPYRKTYFSKLKSLNLSFNLINYFQNDDLQRGSSPKLKKLVIHQKRMVITPLLLQNLKTLVKLKINDQRWGRKQKLLVEFPKQYKYSNESNWLKLISQNTLIYFHQKL